MILARMAATFRALKWATPALLGGVVVIVGAALHGPGVPALALGFVAVAVSGCVPGVALAVAVGAEFGPEEIPSTGAVLVRCWSSSRRPGDRCWSDPCSQLSSTDLDLGFLARRHTWLVRDARSSRAAQGRVQGRLSGACNWSR